MRRTVIASLSAVTLLFGLAACTTGPSAAENAEPTVPVSDNTVVLDVRTPEEHAQGHLEGSVLLDLNGGDFQEALPTLDPEAEYVVYCRSGNRSGQAISLMEQAGFENLTNLGSLEEAAAATGLPTVTQ